MDEHEVVDAIREPRSCVGPRIVGYVVAAETVLHPLVRHLGNTVERGAAEPCPGTVGRPRARGWSGRLLGQLVVPR